MQCPKCGETVDYLNTCVPAELLFHVRLVRDHLRYDRDDENVSDEASIYSCPSCGVSLAEDKDEALAFLKGEGITDERAEYYAELAMQGKDK